MLPNVSTFCYSGPFRRHQQKGRLVSCDVFIMNVISSEKAVGAERQRLYVSIWNHTHGFSLFHDVNSDMHG